MSVGAGFVHLHVHSQYSLLQGMIRIKGLLDRVHGMGMKAVAITDLNQLFGAVDFYIAAKEKGIKPIIGCELLFHPQGHLAPAGQTFHLTVLCKSQLGYENLCKLLTRAYLNTPPAKKGAPEPVNGLVDRALLQEFGEGLIVLSGCLRGELAHHLLAHDETSAQETVEWFQKRFGADYYLELGDSGIPEQDWVNDRLYDVAQKAGLEVVGTCDCHYLDAGDCEAHEVLQCIEAGRNLDFERPESLVPKSFYVKDEATVRQHFERFPGACDNTVVIADKCHVEFKFKDEQGRPVTHLPNFRPTQYKDAAEEAAFDLLEYFYDLSRKGLTRRLEKIDASQWPVYHERLESELQMIAKTGFAGYFLIVADFINWAKENEIPVGPGRGSGAGSLVAYALRITDIDPIEFKLLFERFINPERVSMPDFDVDFCQDRRGEVIEYVAKKYGSSNVSQIITFGKLQARAVIKDVGRVLGLSFAETDQLTKLLPDELNIKIKDAFDKQPELQDKIAQDPKLKKVFEYALALEGLTRNSGVHAAGVIITEKPIETYCPLFKVSDGGVVTQFDKDFAEKIGLVKFDFLGLKTLTVIDQAVRLIRSSGLRPDFTLELMDMRETQVFELIGSGDTDGVFQVESSGMKDLCTRLKPNSIEDLTAINALYRPGPLGSGMVDDFIDRKHGRTKAEYDVPQLETILKDTYGVILYQEQVMQIARELAGYSLGQADMLRRAMGKKKPEEMARHKEIFVKGALERSIPQAKAEGIFDLMAKFAEYGFNKSHSAAYAMLTYQTAYLKAFYPGPFFAALMTTEMSNTDKLAKYISDARAHRMKVHPPDVNASERRFSVEMKPVPGKSPEPEIRFGLEAIKGVGSIAVDEIIEARKAGPFTSCIDLARRVSSRKVNKKVWEGLILAGAIDSIAEVTPSTVFGSLAGLLEYSSGEQEERALGQHSLFDQLTTSEIKPILSVDSARQTLFKPLEAWPMAQKLSQEKQVLGLYLSGHPMDAWQKVCESWLGASIERLCQSAVAAQALPADAPRTQEGKGYFDPQQGRFVRAARKEFRVGGLISELKEITTKKGQKMAFGQLEDLSGKVELVFFPDAYGQFQTVIKAFQSQLTPVLITAEVEAREGAAKCLVKRIESLDEAHLNRTQRVFVRLNTRTAAPDQLRALKNLVLENPGKCDMTIVFSDPESPDLGAKLALPARWKVTPSPQWAQKINQIFGGDVVELV